MPFPVLRELVSMKLPVRLSRRARQTAEQPISFLMEQAVSNPDIISLAAGLVDQQSLPVEETLATVTDLLTDHEAARCALQYGTTQGYERLRELAVEHLERLEGSSAHQMGLSPGRVVITTGSQQLLQLVSDVLLDPGDIVLLGAPDYFVYMSTLASLGARVVAVPLDENGLVPQALVEKLAELERCGMLERVKLVYCASYYQNPTGVSLAAERRAALLQIVEQWSSAGRIFLLEDAAYRELYYGEKSPPSIRSYDTRGQTVILTQTFSKPYAPGLKIGYSVLPDELLDAVLSQKGSHDFGSANFNQHVLAAVMESGRYEDHVAKLRTAYRTKRTAMLESLDREFSRLGIPAFWTRPGGGLYVWLALPKTLDTTRTGELFRRSVQQGVLYVPGEYCFPAEWDESDPGQLGGPRHTMRLSFGVQSIAGIRQGVARLAAAVADCLASTP